MGISSSKGGKDKGKGKAAAGGADKTSGGKGKGFSGGGGGKADGVGTCTYVKATHILSEKQGKINEAHKKLQHGWLHNGDKVPPAEFAKDSSAKGGKDKGKGKAAAGGADERSGGKGKGFSGGGGGKADGVGTCTYVKATHIHSEKQGKINEAHKKLQHGWLDNGDKVPPAEFAKDSSATGGKDKGKGKAAAGGADERSGGKGKGFSGGGGGKADGVGTCTYVKATHILSEKQGKINEAHKKLQHGWLHNGDKVPPAEFAKDSSAKGGKDKGKGKAAAGGADKRSGGKGKGFSGGGGGKADGVGTCTYVKARHILSEKHSKINEAYKKLQHGWLDNGGKVPPAEFAKIAAEYSECPSGKRGGDLGWFPRGKMAGPFQDVAFAIPVGFTTAPFKSTRGYHIILVEGRKN